MKITRKPTPFGILIGWSGLIPFALISMFESFAISMFGLALLLVWYWLFTYTAKLKIIDTECLKELNPKVALGLLLGYLVTTFSVILYLGSDLKIVFYFHLTAIVALTLIDLLAVDMQPNPSGETV